MDMGGEGIGRTKLAGIYVKALHTIVLGGALEYVVWTLVAAAAIHIG